MFEKRKQLYLFILPLLALVIALAFFFYNRRNRGDGHLVYDCMILDADSHKLLRKYPGSRCDYYSDGRAVVAGGLNLSLFGRNGEVLWNKKIRTHHALKIIKGGNILFLSSVIKKEGEEPLSFDRIELFDPSGNEVAHFDFHDHREELLALAEKEYRHYRQRTVISAADPWILFPESLARQLPTLREFSHANSVYRIPPNALEKKNSAFREGNILVNVNGLGLILVLDPELKKILWSITHKQLLSLAGEENVTSIHDLQLMESGDFLFYNNFYRKNASSIEEVNPLTRERKIIFQGNPPESFYANIQGGVQRLDRNNYLITQNAKDCFECTFPPKEPIDPKILKVNTSGETKWSIAAKSEGKNGEPLFWLQEAKLQDLTDFLNNSKQQEQVISHAPPFTMDPEYRGLMEIGRVQWTEFEGIEPQKAEGFLSAKRQGLLDLTKSTMDPYSGRIDQAPYCLKIPSNVTKESPQQLASYFGLYSSPNFVLGNCPKTNGIKTAVLLLYCKDKRTVYSVRAFLLEGQDWPKKPIAHCLEN